MTITLTSSDCIISVDVQNDFIPPNGSLPAEKGQEKILPNLFDFYKSSTNNKSVLLVSTQDWHPQNHCSFKVNGGIWPVHCVQGTPGAEFPDGFPVNSINEKILKATTQEKDAYSGFQGTTDLAQILKSKGIKRVFVTGFVTEVCVKETALDSRKVGGFETFVVLDLCACINTNDVPKTVEELKEGGVKVVTSSEIS